jgi:hypothetical protein
MPRKGIHRSRRTEWRPGISGNPNGRPRGTGYLQRAARICEKLRDNSPETFEKAAFIAYLFLRGTRRRRG